MPEPLSVFAAFRDAAVRWGERPFLNVLPETASAYGVTAGELTYAEAWRGVEALRAAYGAAGYGTGHRVGLLLENRPAYWMHWFALNGLGVSVVPVNPDLRAAELAYLVGHSDMVLAVAISARQPDLRASGCAAVIGPDDAPPAAPFAGGLPGGDAMAEAALLYTSGTTGMPKGCLVSQRWFLECGRWYLGMGGVCAVRPGEDRMLTPLPVFHMNAMANSTMAMVMSGGCLTVLDRFHPTTWWDSVVQAKATIVHCLGVMPAMLLSLPASPLERTHAVRFAFCPGPDRRLHEFQKLE